MFKDLKGIDKGREERIRKSNLDLLLDRSDVLTDHIVRELKAAESLPDSEELFMETLLKTYEHTKKELDDVRFTEDDLRSYLFATANQDQQEMKLLAYCLYTGNLLNILMERNKQENKKTRFYLNGLGEKMDGVFAFASKINEIYLENLAGGGICSAAGCFRGNANIMIAKNIKGSALFAGIGSYNGNANLIIAKDIEGDELMGDINETGGMNSIGLVIAHDVKGDYIFQNIGQAGKIGMIIAKNIQGILDFKNEKLAESAKIIAGINIAEEPDTFIKRYPKETRTYTGKETKKYLAEYRINEINTLVESMDGKTPEEVFDIAEKIQEIYNSIKEKCLKTSKE